jgi:quercetin dioxygenase-like cupin family protein
MEPFRDERGTIEDLCGGDSVYVTRILTKKGAVRGNHVHKQTTQWTMVIKGKLHMATSISADFELGPGEVVIFRPGVAHAWRARKDTDCLVFTKGPRGEDYESDTFKLDEPLL